MKTIKVSELSGVALDWVVATCEGWSDWDGGDPCEMGGFFSKNGEFGWALFLYNYSPSTDWAQGGPIIEREMIQLTPHCMFNPLHGWAAAYRSFDEDDDVYALHRKRGKTPLIAAMRCYVASKIGDTVEVPEELL